MKHTQPQIVPQLWVSSKRAGSFLKVFEGLQELLLFKQGKAKVEEDIGGALGIERADVLVRWGLSRFSSLSIAVSIVATACCRFLALGHGEWLVISFANYLQLGFFGV